MSKGGPGKVGVTPHEAMTMFADPEVERAYSNCHAKLQQRMRADVLRQKLIRGTVRAEGYIGSGVDLEAVEPDRWRDADVRWPSNPWDSSATFGDGTPVTGLRLMAADAEAPHDRAVPEERRLTLGPWAKPSNPRAKGLERVFEAMAADGVTAAELLTKPVKELADQYRASERTIMRLRRDVRDGLDKRAG
jgi:hypothetical protein